MPGGGGVQGAAAPPQNYHSMQVARRGQRYPNMPRGAALQNICQNCEGTLSIYF